MNRLAYEKSISEKTAASRRFLRAAGVVLCVILLLVLLVNLFLILRGYTDEGSVPSVGGYLSLVAQDNSMYPTIRSGDLVICRTDQAQDVVVGDVIAYYDPAGNGITAAIGRVTAVTVGDGALFFTTKGDAVSAAEPATVPASSLVGVYCTRIAGAGRAAVFMQSAAGLILCVVPLLLLLVGCDILRRREHDRAEVRNTVVLTEELELLQAERDAQRAEKQRQEDADWGS
jgi:signal peptidase